MFSSKGNDSLYQVGNLCDGDPIPADDLLKPTKQQRNEQFTNA